MKSKVKLTRAEAKKKRLRERKAWLNECLRLHTDKEYALKKAEEAYPRKDYINHIETVIVGAAVEFFKCRIVDKIGVNHEHRAHWEKEWRFHLGEKLWLVVSHTITFNNRRKAIDQVIAETTPDVDRFMVIAANTIAKYLDASRSKMQRVLDERDAADFMNELETALDEHLDKQEQQ